MEFGMSIARHLILDEIKNGCKKNLVLSPLSIHIALNMLASGTSGRTLEQLLRFLETDSITHLNAQSSFLMELATGDTHDDLPPPEDPLEENPYPQFGRPITSRLLAFYASRGGPMICLVNGIWIAKCFQLKHSFKQLAEDVYKANAQSVDFLNQGEQVKNEVNSWARKASKGHIDPFLTDTFSQDAILVLANALYFKGTWVDEFNADKTVDEDFHLLNGKTVRVPFMKKWLSHNYYGSFDGFKLLKMNYRIGKLEHKKYAMYFFLPDNNDGLQELLEKFHSEPTFLLENRKLEYVELNELWLPKLKYEYTLNVSETMKELGLDLPFDDKEAEIKDMVETSEVVYVSKAINKSYIEVNEKGTIATAATIYESRCGFDLNQYIEPAKISFIADHPFLFMIKEEVSGVVLFVGAALNPVL